MSGIDGRGRGRDRGQVSPGGIVKWFAGFVTLFFGGALFITFLRTQAADPLVTYAENMEWSSAESTKGLEVFGQWLDLMVPLVVVIACLYFISRAYLQSRNGRF